MKSPAKISRTLPFVLAVAATLSCRDRDLPTHPAVSPASYVFSSATPIVNDTLDTGDGTCTVTRCTLRDAVAFVDSGGTITFSVTGTIHLSTGTPILVLKPLSIQGPGAANLTITSDSTSRIFDIYSTAAGPMEVVIRGLTIADANSADPYGGAIYNEVHLVLDSVVVTRAKCTSSGNVYGGLVYSEGPLVVTHSTLSYGWADAGGVGYGGAIFAGDSLTVTASRILGSKTTGATFSLGGGIFANSFVLITSSTIAGDTATQGGGMYADHSVAKIDRTTISGNVARDDGGGLYADNNVDLVSDRTLIMNSTISGNSAAYGGGLFNWGGVTIVDFTTITANSAGSNGSGIWSYNDDVTRTSVKASIVAGNTDTPDLGVGATYGFASAGYNVIGTGDASVNFSVEFVSTGDTTGVTAPGLGTLQVNAPGANATHALTAESPALDRSDCLTSDSLNIYVDGRGVTRPQPVSGACDAGAYELVQTPQFSSSCSFTVSPKNDSRSVTVSWANASPGVVQVIVMDGGRATQKAMAPLDSGSVTLRLRTGIPTYTLLGGTARRAVTDTLAGPGAACDGP